MKYKILYIEDNDDDFNRMITAIEEINIIQEEKNRQQIELLEQINHPNDIKDKTELILSADIIIADVYFNGESLLEIIASEVKKIFSTAGFYDPPPLVALTSEHARTLEYAAEIPGLIDVWPKTPVIQEYLVWRIRSMTSDIALKRPDHTTRKLILSMNSKSGTVWGNIRWHDKVIEMVKSYTNQENEQSQVVNVGTHIKAIAENYNAEEQVQELWGKMVDWEPVERSLFVSVRGHARHVINVFWLGYYLLNNKDIYTSLSHQCNEQQFLGNPPESNQREHVNSVWLIIGLFHDIGNIISKAHKGYSEFHSHIEGFENVVQYPKNLEPYNNKYILKEFNNYLSNSLDETTYVVLYEAWKESYENINNDYFSPDSGYIGAVILHDQLKANYPEDAIQKICASTAVHNLIGERKINKDVRFSWKKHPYIALLIFCDQLQTWDRERDTTSVGEPLYERAELLWLKVNNIDKKITVDLAIKYHPASIDLIGLIGYTDKKNKLIEIIKTRPLYAIDTLDDWPFKVNLEFYYSDSKILERTYPKIS